MGKRLGARDIVGCGPGFRGDGEDAFGRRKQEPGLGVNKPADQPGAGDAVYFGPLAGDPSVRPGTELAAARQPKLSPAPNAMFEVTGVAPGCAERRCRILADFLPVRAIDDDGTPLGQLTTPMIDLLGRATDRADDDRIVGLESRTPPNVDDDRSRLGAEPDIKGLWRNRKTAFSIHDRALLALRAAQNLGGRPSDGASAVPRGTYIYYVGRPRASLNGSLRRPPVSTGEGRVLRPAPPRRVQHGRFCPGGGKSPYAYSHIYLWYRFRRPCCWQGTPGLQVTSDARSRNEDAARTDVMWFTVHRRRPLRTRAGIRVNLRARSNPGVE